MESDFGEVESDSDKARRCPSACSENKDYSMKRFLFDKRLAKHGLDEHACNCSYFIITGRDDCHRLTVKRSVKLFEDFSKF